MATEQQTTPRRERGRNGEQARTARSQEPQEQQSSQQLETRQQQQPQGARAQRELQRAGGRESAMMTLVPPVDIFEDAGGIVVQADLPGVSRDRLSIECDRNTLTIEGEAVLDVPQNTEALHADVRSTHYRRSFSLSTELDTERVEANLKDGVLMLRIPRRTEYQRRRIDVRVD